MTTRWTLSLMAVVLLPCPTPAAEPPRADLTGGLIAHFTFDKDCRDQSGNKNHGRPRNGPRFVRGVIGSALALDGKDDFVIVVPKSDVSKVGDFSLSVWTYVEDWKSTRGDGRFLDSQYIFDGHSSSPMFRKNGYLQPGFFAIYGLMRGGEEIHNGVHLAKGHRWYWEQKIPAKLKGRWRHMVFSRKGAEDLTYLDGKPVKAAHAFANKHERVLDMQHPWFIGTFSGNDPDYPGIRSGINYSFHGQLDDMRIYRRALSEADIAALYRLGEKDK